MRKTDYQAVYDKSCQYWLRPSEEGYLLGLSDWGQYLLGAISSVEDWPTVGQIILPEETLCLLASNKATNELVAPIPCEIIETNPMIIHEPSLINLDCYGQGWLFKINAPTAAALQHWLTPKKYEEEINGLFRK